MYNPSTTDVPSPELLKEVLKRGELQFYPKFKLYLSNFIDAFNDEKVQSRVKQHINEFNQKLHSVKSSSSVFEMLCRFRDFLEHIKLESPPANFYNRLQHSGYLAIVNDKRFNFLEEEGTTQDARVEKLLKLIDQDQYQAQDESQESDDRAFQEYIQSWSTNQRKWRRPENYISQEVNTMKIQRRDLLNHSNKVMNQIIADIVEVFEHLRQKLTFNGEPLHEVDAKANGVIFAAGAGPALAALAALTIPGVGLIIGGVITAAGVATSVGGAVAAQAVKDKVVQRHEPNKAKYNRRKKRGWFDGVINFIQSFLNNEKTERELRKFIQIEFLEEDLQDFKERYSVWLDKFSPTPFCPDNLLISKPSAMAEIERLRSFMYAVVLNEPDLHENHVKSTNEFIQASLAANSDTDRPNFLPFLSFGQLPLMNSDDTDTGTGNANRSVRVTFVLNSNSSLQVAHATLAELARIFETLRYSEEIPLQDENGKILLHVEMDVCENLSNLIAKNLTRLYDLNICAVMIGTYGIACTSALYPPCHRIYGNESAEGFIRTPAWRRGRLVYGGEPYLCPTGWRRYAINVGKDKAKFQQTYGDWPVAYHGSAGHLSVCILQNGLKASGEGCYLPSGEGRIYLTPSIEYAGHPGYAQVWKMQNKYVQLVLQLRVKSQLIFDKKPGTLPGAFPKELALDQDNFEDNNTLEWIIKYPPGCCLNHGIIIYGLMLRVTDQHPSKLPQCAWWGKKWSDK